MYEFHIQHIACNDTDIIFGYDFNDACRRSKFDPEEWQIIMQEYVD